MAGSGVESVVESSDCKRCLVLGRSETACGALELAALLGSLQAAVGEGALRAVATSEPLAGAGQLPFTALDLAQPWPDVLQYRFDCTGFGRVYELSIDAYHGSRAEWRAMPRP